MAATLTLCACSGSGRDLTTGAQSATSSAGPATAADTSVAETREREAPPERDERADADATTESSAAREESGLIDLTIVARLDATSPEATPSDLAEVASWMRNDLESAGLSAATVEVVDDRLVVAADSVASTETEVITSIIETHKVVELRPVEHCASTSDGAGTGNDDVMPVIGADEWCVVGPPGGSGEVFDPQSAEAVLDARSGWGVSVGLRADRAAVFDGLASTCFHRSSRCPSGRLAIVVGREIQSAPVVNAPAFSAALSITGEFSESDARALARTIKRAGEPAPVIESVTVVELN